MKRCKRVPLGGGGFALVDCEDFELVSKFSWHKIPAPNRVYASTTNNNSYPKSIGMHRVVMNAPKGTQVDHINGNGLDNRKSNLRITNNQGNSRGKRTKVKNSTSRFIGVHWSKRKNRWISNVAVMGNIYCAGLFKDEIEAAKARDRMACLIGFNREALNFPEIFESRNSMIRILFGMTLATLSKPTNRR